MSYLVLVHLNKKDFKIVIFLGKIFQFSPRCDFRHPEVKNGRTPVGPIGIHSLWTTFRAVAKV